MAPLGSAAPDFVLPDGDGRVTALSDLSDAKALLVAFWCNHCPFVKHIRQGFRDFAAEYMPEGLAVVAINSNDATTHPADAPQEMVKEAKAWDFPFPYLVDESQEVARKYQAACTPDFFLFDQDRKLAYRGQFDASRPSNGVPVTGGDLRAAADALLSGQRPSDAQTPSVGCNIKWKPAAGL